MNDSDLLSVIVILGGDDVNASRAMEALAGQRNAPHTEIIVPFFPTLVDSKMLRETWPSIRFVEMPDAPPPPGPEWEHRKVDRLRAVGLQAARGEVIALLQDNALPEKDWSASIWAEHKARPEAVIGGGIVYAGRRLLDRASFYCDFGRYGPPFPETRGGYASVLNLAYKRKVLEECRDAWESFFDESVLHRRILANGGGIVLIPDIRVRYQPAELPIGIVLRRKIGSGRSFAGRRAQSVGAFRRILLMASSPMLAPLMLFRQLLLLRKRDHPLAPWLAASPLIFICLLCWSLGELQGYVSGEPFGKPPEPVC